MKYLLFLPGGNESPDCLKKYGLDELFFDGQPVLTIATGRTPTGERGSFASYMNQEPGDVVAHYDPSWTWRSVGDYWVGWNPNHPPGPSDLLRNERVQGFNFELLDGNRWMFPIYSRVEHAYGINDEGHMVKVPADKHRYFFNRALEVQKDIFESLGLSDILAAFSKEVDDFPDENVLVTIKDGVKFIASAMCINYRINYEICLALELFNDELMSEIIANIVELPGITAVKEQKKTLDTVIIPVG